MLRSLTQVAFARLTDAYGPATEVPDMLWALARAESEESARAPLSRLEDRLAHQGTVVPAICLACLPFLVELAEAKIPASAGVLALLGRLGAGGRDEEGIPVAKAFARTFKRATADALKAAFAETSDVVEDASRRAAAAYALTLLGGMTKADVSRVASLAEAPGPHRATLLTCLARMAPAAHLHVFRSALDDPSPTVRASAYAGLARGGAFTDEDFDRVAEVLAALGPDPSLAFASGAPGVVLVRAVEPLGARAAYALYDHASPEQRHKLGAAVVRELGEGAAPRELATCSLEERDRLTWLAARDDLFENGSVRQGLRARGLPDEPLALSRFLGLVGPALMDELRLIHGGKDATVREHWVAVCEKSTGNDALGALARSLAGGFDATQLVRLVPELRSLEVPWGFTARRMMVVLLAAMLPGGRQPLEGLARKLETEGPFRFFPRLGVVRDTALLPMVTSALSGSGRLEVGPRQYVDVGVLLAEALGT